MADMEQRIQELTGAVNALVLQNQENQRTIDELRTRARHESRDVFRIPDPIKMIPPYDGNRRQLAAWLRTAEDTLEIFRPRVTADLFKVYTQAVINKVEGKARDVLCLAGAIDNFEDFKSCLINTLGDRQELSTYKSQLWTNKMDADTNIHKYYQKTSELTQNIKTLSKQNPLYRDNWEAINSFINEDALAAFITGLRKPYFGYAQAAKPKDLEEAYAFLCKFTSNERASFSNNKTQRPSKADNNKTPYKNQSKSDWEKPSQPLPEPMDVDRSLRSRMTYNKKLINNHECDSEEKDEEVQDEQPSDDEEIGVNFWVAPREKRKN